MAERPRRSAQEREAARRAREARRAQQAGRPAPYEEAAAAFEADPPVFDTPTPGPTTTPPLALTPPADPAEEPEPAPAERPPEPLVSSRDARPPIKSFPSPPDPAFYVPDAELEVPSGTRRVPRRSARPPRRHPWRGRIAAGIALVLAAAVIWFVFELFQPLGTSPHGQVTVTVAPSTASSQVGKALARDGVISSSFFFELRATLDGDRSKLRAGTYHLQKGMSYGAVLKRLTARPAAARTTELTIAEGHTRQYVATLLRKQHIKGDYLAATRHSALLNPRRYGAPRSTDTLEGFLFPDTFSLTDPVRVSALVDDQLTDFKRRIASVDMTAAHRRHFSDYQILTVASLIEAEAASQRDRPLVASVIFNRLRDHMMLQLDSTARYATGNFTKPLTVSQLASKSPYNTHTHFGLPPGPIDSPGLAAIDAAAHPATSDYLYFFAKPCTNRTVFATSLAQFDNLLRRDYRPHCG